MNNSLFGFVAIQAALKAGTLLQHGFETTYKISEKEGAHNLVTEYDEKAEVAIIEVIKSHFPNHIFLAEESGWSKTKSDSEIVWMIDPLDGTVNFAHHIPFFAVSIAAVINNCPEVGVIYNPMTQELFYAEKGKGAFLNGSPIHVNNTSLLKNSLGVTGRCYKADKTKEHLERCLKITEEGNPLRDFGSAAMHLAYVAAGRLDLFIMESLQPWDVAAGNLLVLEAKGNVTHYSGKPYQLLQEDRSILATNQLLTPKLLNILNI